MPNEFGFCSVEKKRVEHRDAQRAGIIAELKKLRGDALQQMLGVYGKPPKYCDEFYRGLQHAALLESIEGLTAGLPPDDSLTPILGNLASYYAKY